jgi:hypothetical protein
MRQQLWGPKGQGATGQGWNVPKGSIGRVSWMGGRAQRGKSQKSYWTSEETEAHGNPEGDFWAVRIVKVQGQTTACSQEASHFHNAFRGRGWGGG